MTTEYHTPFGFIRYCLVQSKKDIKKVVKKYGIDDFEPAETGGACVNFNHVNDFYLAIVHLPETDEPLHERLAMLTHEAVHIKQELMSIIKEDMPSIELEAYIVEEIAHNLFKEYLSTK